MNKICGIDISGNHAVLLLVEGTKEAFSIVETRPLKIELSDHSSSDHIKEFYKAVHTYFAENKIEHVAFKSGSTGRFKSGPAVFKMEALIQMCDIQVAMVKPQTLTAFWKKNGPSFDHLGLKKYQENAFKVGYYFLGDQ